MSLHKHFDSYGPNLLIKQHLCRWRYPLSVFYFLIMLINREKKHATDGHVNENHTDMKRRVIDKEKKEG